MSLVTLSIQEQIELCNTINTYSTIYSWMVPEPFVTDDSHFLQYLPQTSIITGYAVVPIMIESEKVFITHLKQKFGGNANIMSFLNTQTSLAKEQGDEFKIDWVLRVYKEKKLFGKSFKIHSNIMPNFGNTGITLGLYQGKSLSSLIHDLFLDMN